MPKNTSSTASPQKLTSGYSALFYILLFSLLLFDALSGYTLFAHKEMDFYKLYLMKAHTVSGIALFYLFIFLSFVHLKRLYRLTITFWTFLAALSFYILCILEAHPQTALVIFLIFNVYLTRKYLLSGPASHKLSVLTGVISWSLLNLIFISGMALGGPMKTFRTNLFNTMHQWVALCGTPFLFYHLLFHQDVHFTRKKVIAFLCILCINVALFEISFKNAGWFQTHRASKNVSGYSPSIPPSMPFSAQNAKTCGENGCHTEIYKEWKVSTHRFSASNLAYKKVFALFVKEMGKDNAGFCERCHNPDVVIFSEESKNSHTYKFFASQGISCLSCHLISKNNVKTGNGFVEIKKDTPYLPGFHPETKKEWLMLHYFIRTDLRLHRKNYQRRPFYQSSEFCATCHRITVPAEVNDAKTFVFEGPYASWSKSRYAKEGITCAHCHLQLFEFHDPQSIERPFHARPDHRTLGINASLAFYLEKEKQQAFKKELDAFSKETLGWLKGTLRISSYEQWFLRYVRDKRADAFDKYFQKPFLSMKIKTKGGIADGKKFELIVETKNERVGHNFPVSLFDMIDVWLEIFIQDANGRVIFQSGILDKKHHIPDGTHRLGGTLVDKYGNPIDRHRVWKTAAIKNKRVISPLGEIRDTFMIPLPPDSHGQLNIYARWLYRRANPQFSYWLFDEKKKTFPVIPLVSVEQTYHPE